MFHRILLPPHHYQIFWIKHLSGLFLPLPRILQAGSPFAQPLKYHKQKHWKQRFPDKRFHHPEEYAKDHFHPVILPELPPVCLKQTIELFSPLPPLPDIPDNPPVLQYTRNYLFPIKHLQNDDFPEKSTHDKINLFYNLSDILNEPETAGYFPVCILSCYESLPFLPGKALSYTEYHPIIVLHYGYH